LKELFIKEVINNTIYFLDNNQRVQLKEILTEIGLNYQIERINQLKSKKHKRVIQIY